MEHTDAQLAAADGLVLLRRAWRPEGEPAAVLAVVHGYGEHGGRYRGLAEDMATRGCAAHVYDLRGHGRSSGSRARFFNKLPGFERVLVARVKPARRVQVVHGLVILALPGE